jgi:hypothetical protein
MEHSTDGRSAHRAHKRSIMEGSKGLSADIEALLGTPEGSRHDFKETAESLHVDDLVAFANAEGGVCCWA